jgi:hypothetical protein
MEDRASPYAFEERKGSFFRDLLRKLVPLNDPCELHHNPRATQLSLRISPFFSTTHAP